MEIIAFDSHKRHTVCSVENEKGEIIDERRINHERGALRAHLERFTPGSTVAVETIGNWYWIVDEIEQAKMKPALTHALKAKRMMLNTNKIFRLIVSARWADCANEFAPTGDQIKRQEVELKLSRSPLRPLPVILYSHVSIRNT